MINITIENLIDDIEDNLASNNGNSSKNANYFMTQFSEQTINILNEDNITNNSKLKKTTWRIN